MNFFLDGAFHWLISTQVTLILGKMTLIQSQQRQLDILWVLEQQALNLERCFELLVEEDASENPVVDERLWSQWMRAVRPDLSPFCVTLFFACADKNSSGELTLDEFVDVGDVIEMAVSRLPSEASDERPSARLGEPRSRREVWRDAMRTAAFSRGVFVVSLVGVAATWRGDWEVDGIVAAAALAEVVARLGAEHDFEVGAQRDLDAVDAAVTGAFGAGGFVLAAFGPAGRVAARVCRSLRHLRILAVVDRCGVRVHGRPLRLEKVVVATLLNARTVVRLFAIALLFTYVAAAVGMEALCGRVASCAEGRCVDVLGGDDDGARRALRKAGGESSNLNFYNARYAFVSMLVVFFAGPGDAMDYTFWRNDGGDVAYAAGRAEALTYLFWSTTILVNLLILNVVSASLFDSWETQEAKLEMPSKIETHLDMVTADGAVYRVEASRHPVRDAIRDELLRFEIERRGGALDTRGLRQQAIGKRSDARTSTSVDLAYDDGGLDGADSLVSDLSRSSAPPDGDGDGDGDARDTLALDGGLAGLQGAARRLGVEIRRDAPLWDVAPAPGRAHHTDAHHINHLRRRGHREFHRDLCSSNSDSHHHHQPHHRHRRAREEAEARASEAFLASDSSAAASSPRGSIGSVGLDDASVESGERPTETPRRVSFAA